MRRKTLAWTDSEQTKKTEQEVMIRSTHTQEYAPPAFCGLGYKKISRLTVGTKKYPSEICELSPKPPIKENPT